MWPTLASRSIRRSTHSLRGGRDARLRPRRFRRRGRRTGRRRHGEPCTERYRACQRVPRMRSISDRSKHLECRGFSTRNRRSDGRNGLIKIFIVYLLQCPSVGFSRGGRGGAFSLFRSGVSSHGWNGSKPRQDGPHWSGDPVRCHLPLPRLQERAGGRRMLCPALVPLPSLWPAWAASWVSAGASPRGRHRRTRSCWSSAMPARRTWRRRRSCSGSCAGHRGRCIDSAMLCAGLWVKNLP